MKTFFSLVALFIVSYATAQQSPSVNRYSVDSIDYYEVSNCVPGTIASFYSRVDGGYRLRADSVDGDGKVTIQVSSDFRPGMLINDGIGGSQRVTFIEPPEFSISSLRVTGATGTSELVWQGTAASLSDISFKVFSSVDGISYQPVSVVNVQSNNAPVKHDYMKSWSGESVLYKVAVISKSKGARYVSKPILLAADASITVFPTLVSDALFIDLPVFVNGASFNIVNAIGQKMEDGNLNTKQTSINMNKFPAGNYIVSVRNGIESRVVKVTKL